jgi:xanthine dehydrogenase accessory factor
VKLETLAALNEARRARRAALLVTSVADGTERLVDPAALTSDPLAAHLDLALRTGKSALVEEGGTQFFISVQTPPLRILCVGAVHISQALVPMARMLGHDAIIVDPRTAFATPERFPDVPLYAEWPDTIIPKLGVDRYTAVVLLTHDPKIDDPALHLALRSDSFYIGALGSRKTHAKRVERLQEAGFSAEATARIHAPIGLNIGAVSPAEIALSILGQITASLRLKPDGSRA